MTNHKIAIIGAGASGTIAAIELLLKPQKFVIDIINDSSTICRGLAYGTKNEEHLLNVPCKKMSVIKKDPAHFHTWLIKNGHKATQDTFASRSTYGNYLEYTLSEVQKNSDSKLTFRHGEALSVRKIPDGIELELENKQFITYDSLIIASGWGPRLQHRENTKLIINLPYQIPEVLPEGSDAVILGTSLTAIDVLLTLRKQGFQGEVKMISRRGLLPKTHLTEDPLEPYIQQRRSLREQLKFFREQSKVRASKNFSWHGLIDGFRAYTQDFWQNLSKKEKSVFLRHLRPYWDVHRHRIAPQIAEIISNEISSSKLKVISASILSVKENKSAVEIEIKKRGQKSTEKYTPAFVVDARGVKVLGQENTPHFIKLMLEQGLAGTDYERLGLNCSIDCVMLDSQGKINENMYLIGPLTMGSLWESIAIPDIVPMAGKIATQIEERLLKRK